MTLQSWWSKRSEPGEMKFLLLLTLLFACAGCKNGPPPDMTDPGQLLYLGYTLKEVNCSRCHGPEGQGGSQAPALDSSFYKYTDDQILDIIEDGKGKGDDAMPPFEGQLSETDLDDLLRFLRTLKGQTP